MVFWGSASTIFFSLCSWQYSKGFFEELGIKSSFSHLDNLIFLFDKILSINFYESSGWSFSCDILLRGFIIPFLIILLMLLKKKQYLFCKNELWKKDNELKYHMGILLSLFLFIIFEIIKIVASEESILPTIVLFLFFLHSAFSFAKNIWTEKYDISFTKPFFSILFLFLIFSSFKAVGKSDAKKIKKRQFRDLNTICISGISGTKKNSFDLCGKLIYENSTYLCIKERDLLYPHCRKKDQYEITIIPNNNNN